MSSLDKRSKELRRHVIRMMEVGKRGHIGAAMSLIEILRVLFDSILKYDAKNPLWEKRDRFILSKGHGCLGLYSILVDKGFFPISELDQFCKPTSFLGGHPERGKTPGVEASTGALGHGLPMAVGMAVAAKLKKAEYRVFVVVGDGELNEGSNWEAAMSASKHKLSNLVLIVDHNKLQSYGVTTEVLDLSPMSDKFKSFGFETIEVDGHDISALEALFKKLPLNPAKPTAIICHTIKSKGIPYAEGQADWHHKSGLKPEDFVKLYSCLE